MKTWTLGASLLLVLWGWAGRAQTPPHSLPGPVAPAAEETAILADSTMVPAPDAVRAAGGEVDTSVTFSIVTGSRLYPEWREENRVHLNETFYIGDTEFSARVTRFLPDFIIDQGQFLSASSALNNPAVHIYVYGDSGAVDSTWAFQNFPPHFSPNSFWSFQLKEVNGYKADSPSVPPTVTKEEK